MTAAFIIPALVIMWCMISIAVDISAIRGKMK